MFMMDSYKSLQSKAKKPLFLLNIRATINIIWHHFVNDISSKSVTLTHPIGNKNCYHGSWFSNITYSFHVIIKCYQAYFYVFLIGWIAYYKVHIIILCSYIMDNIYRYVWQNNDKLKIYILMTVFWHF